MISRNSTYQFAEDLPRIHGLVEVRSSDEYGFALRISEVSFDQLNYLLSLLVDEAFQSSADEQGYRHNSYSCKVQKSVAHLIEVDDDFVELTIHQDSDAETKLLKSSVNLASHVSEVVDEVGQELFELMGKLKAKGSSNEKLVDEFERLSKIFDQK